MHFFHAVWAAMTRGSSVEYSKEWARICSAMGECPARWSTSPPVMARSASPTQPPLGRRMPWYELTSPCEEVAVRTVRTSAEGGVPRCSGRLRGSFCVMWKPNSRATWRIRERRTGASSC